MSRKTRLRLDFLTTQKNSDDNHPPYFRRFENCRNSSAIHGLPTGRTESSGVDRGPISDSGNLPDPGRFAVHKLVLAQARSFDRETKGTRDIQQACEVILALDEKSAAHDVKRAVLVIVHDYPETRAMLYVSASRIEGVAKAIVEGALANS